MDKPPLTVALGIPIDCGHRHEFWLSLIQFIHLAPRYLHGGSLQFIWNPGDSLICRARNNIVHDFLMNPCVGQPDYLLFLDTDISFEPQQIFRLLNHRVKGIVCGQYFLKQPKMQGVFNGLTGEKPDENGLLKVRDAGTGCMVIHREVFKTMQDKMDATHFYTCDANKDRRFSFFDAGVVGGRYLSEDWLFCHRTAALGFPVLLDTQVTVKHHGWATYPMEPEAPVEKAE